jgi:methyltransferase (TIGR00027 family)
LIYGKPSHTAIHVAATRAAHLRYDTPPYLLRDEKAQDLLGSEYEPMIESLADGAHWALRENRLFVPLRARYVEDRLREAYKSGVRQYVILGAGLDSYALRQPEDMAPLNIIEVDHPSTQAWKRERLKQLGWATPPNVTFIECDFETSSVSEALRRAGFDARAPALISWMGVIYYLERPVAQQALGELNGLLAPGSEVILDYLMPYEDLAPRYLELVQTSGQYLKKVGEPHVNKLRAPELEADILGAGFDRALLESHETIRGRYLDAIASETPLSERFGLAVALNTKETT